MTFFILLFYFFAHAHKKRKRLFLVLRLYLNSEKSHLKNLSAVKDILQEPRVRE